MDSGLWITLLCFIFGIVGLVFGIRRFYTRQKLSSNTIAETKDTSPSKKYISRISTVVIIAIVTLPFHYYFGDNGFRVFAKTNLTFSYTFVTQDDIEKVISRYDKASLLEKQSIRNEPFVRKLMEEGLLIEKGLFDK